MSEKACLPAAHPPVLLEAFVGLRLQLLVQLPLRRELQDQVDTLVVVKVAKHLQNVWVPKKDGMVSELEVFEPIVFFWGC